VLPIALAVGLVATVGVGMLVTGSDPEDRPSGEIAIAGNGISLVNLSDRTARWLSTEGVDVSVELAWSPSGDRLAALLWQSLTVLEPPMNETSPRQVFAGYSNLDSENVVRWSPDGTRLVLLDGSETLVVLDASTGQASPIPSLGPGTRFPSWSPDGEWLLAFVPGRHPELRIFRPDGRDMRSIGRGWTGMWSPDGERVAVAMDDGDTSGLAIVTVATGASDRLPVNGGPGSIWPVEWAPDGREILCTGGEGDIGVVDVATGRWRQIATGTTPRWSPDGGWIAYVAALPGQPPDRKGGPHRSLGVFVTDSVGAREPILIAPNVSYYGLAWRPGAASR
jgi:Tol biopolymer transport system component